MSEFERQIYADLKSTDRVSLWVAKCMELAEFSCILTDEDIDGIAMVYKTMRKKDDPSKRTLSQRNLASWMTSADWWSIGPADAATTVWRI